MHGAKRNAGDARPAGFRQAASRLHTDKIEDDEPFEEKMQRLTVKLEEQFSESARFEKAILRRLGHDR